MRELKELKPVSDDESDLFKAMKLIAQTEKDQKSNSKYGLQYKVV